MTSCSSTAYKACSRWDAWLRKYRDTRGPALSRASAPTTPATTTARAGRACPTAVRMLTRRSFLRALEFRACVLIFRRRYTAVASHWLRWRRCWASTTRLRAGSRTRRRCGSLIITKLYDRQGRGLLRSRRGQQVRPRAIGRDQPRAGRACAEDRTTPHDRAHLRGSVDEADSQSEGVLGALSADFDCDG